MRSNYIRDCERRRLALPKMCAVAQGQEAVRLLRADTGRRAPRCIPLTRAPERLHGTDFAAVRRER
jgi:hypothetical protein